MFMYYIPHVFLLMYLLALLGSQKEQIGFNSKNIFLTFLSLLCQSLIDSPPLLVGGYGGCMSQQLHPHIYTPSYIHTIIYTHHHIYTPSYIHTIIYTHYHIYTPSYIHTINLPTNTYLYFPLPCISHGLYLYCLCHRHRLPSIDD